MTRNRERERNSTTRSAAAIALFSALLGLSYACSLIVENRSQQCQGDADCSQFGAGYSCDPAQHVCVSKSGTQSSGSGSGGGDCGAPVTNKEILNACTDSSCKAFDNKTRCTNLLPDGGRPPLP